MNRNVAIYPWFKFVQSLIFWQATWFLYFEHHLSAPEAILLYVVYDIATTAFEVPSGYMSDRMGRKLTLIAAGLSSVAATVLLIFGSSFFQFTVANILLGAGAAFASGTDSSLLYESLRSEGREKEIETSELRAWRFSFAGLALSALSGGLLALDNDVLPYVATAIAAFATLFMTTLFREPTHEKQIGHGDSLRDLISSLKQPTLVWLLGLSVAMYAFSHIPFVFGQPFIREALTTAGYAAQTPVVSGGVTFLMMAISLLASAIALPLRNRLGLPAILLLAFGMQVALTFALATNNGLFVIALLFFRMVPDSLSQPFIRARIQPLLHDSTRATYLSIKSLAGRVLFAITLSLAAARTSSDAPLPYADLQMILYAYVAFGVGLFLILLLTTRRAFV